MRNNFGFRLKYKSRTFLDKIINSYGGNGIYNIKGENSLKNKHALIIYTAEAITKHLSNTLHSFASLTSHSGFNESIKLLEAVIEMGYTVDYFNLKDTPIITWEKYELIIDAGKNIEYSIPIAGQKKIYYSTCCHWKTFYNNAFLRTESFYKRNNILLYPDREIVANYGDEFADVITCFGGSYQANSYLNCVSKVKNINISTTHLPINFIKKIGTKNKFMWYGGYGAFHKGLDIVLEAFLKMPAMELHIFGHIESNEKMLKWFNIITHDAKNIFYHGWITPETKIFEEYVQQCDAIVFASSSEGGAGSVIQCLQFGLIPILNDATAIDLIDNEFRIIGNNPEEEIESIIENVTRFNKTDIEKLQEYSNTLKEHFIKKNTLKEYSNSIKNVLLSI